MPGYVVRVDAVTHRMIRELAQGAESMQDVVAQAVEDLRRKRILDRANAAFAALRSDAAASAEEEEEREAWDVTLTDGLETVDADGVAG